MHVHGVPRACRVCDLLRCVLLVYPWALQVVLEAIESGACRESSPSPKDQVRVVERVVDMAHNIRAGRFEATPSTMTCGLCPFQRSCSKAHQ